MNILILGEDAGEDTVPRTDESFKSVFDALSSRLSDEGFNVIDEPAALGDFLKGRVERSDGKITDIARGVEDPVIDAAFVFSIHTRIKHAFYNTRVIARIAGRLVNVKTGERVGEFELVLPQYKTDRDWYVMIDCRHECLFEAVGKNADVVADGIRGELAPKLTVLQSEAPD